MPNIDLRKKVRIHKALSFALSELTLKELEYECLFFLFAKISKSHKNETTYNLNLNEFEALTGRSSNLAEYKVAIKQLRKITFEIRTDEYTLIDGVLSSAKFITGKRTMEVKISSDMKPFLLELTQNYTEHQLYSIIRLKSKHAKKLYLYFNQYRPKSGIIRTKMEMETIEDFKIKTKYKNPETLEELHPKWSNFKMRVLDVAKNEINALSNIKIAYYTKKYGRETYWIEWHIENKKNDELIQLDQFHSSGITSGDKDFTKKLNDINDLALLVDGYGLSKTQAEWLLKKVEKTKIFEVLSNIDLDKNIYIPTGNPIFKMGGYSVKILQKEFGVDLVKFKMK